MPPARDLPPLPAPVAALPRQRGYPVPYVADWTSGRFTRQTLPQAGEANRCVGCTVGQGRAMLGVSCVERQRHAMAHRRCGVCGLHLTAPMVMIGVVEAAPISVEPGLHPACAAFSLRACPRLRALGDGVPVAVLDDYVLVEERLIPAPDGRQDAVYAFIGTGAATVGGVLNFFGALLPPATRWRTAATWHPHMR